MPLPTGSTGRSWITTAQNSPTLALPLPAPYVVIYRARRPEEYLTCVGLGTRRIGVILREFESASVNTTRTGVFDLIYMGQTSTTFPGIIDAHTFQFINSFRFGISSQSIGYGLTDTGSERFGLVVNTMTASAEPGQLSLSPYDPPSGSAYYGDMWFNPTSSNGTEQGLRFINTLPNGATKNVRVLGALNSTDISSSFQTNVRFVGNRAVSSSYLDVNGLTVNDWIVTSGNTGWRNILWDGGLAVDTSSVYVYGPNKNFRVPSGSVTSSLGVFSVNTIRVNSGSLTLLSGSVVGYGGMFVRSGSIIINSTLNTGSVGIYGDTVRFALTGTFASASLRGYPIGVVLAGTSNHLALSDNEAPDGTVYLYTNSNLSYLKANGRWYGFGSSNAIDGGTY
jgi:hypothetical protein